jgi:hypothetical protein
LSSAFGAGHFRSSSMNRPRQPVGMSQRCQVLTSDCSWLPTHR